MIPSVILAFVLISPLLIAGQTTSTTSNHGDWCSAFNDLGKFHSDPAHPYIQSFLLEGRLHYQSMLIHGNDANGNSFHNSADNFRRGRIGVKSEFLQYFKAKADIDMLVDDRFRNGDLDWGYQSFDIVLLTFDLQKAFCLKATDILTLTFGRHKLDISSEIVESTNNIITIERSAIANKAGANARPTGLSMQAGKNHWLATTAIFSTEADSEFIDTGFNDGLAYFGAIDYIGFKSFKLRLDAVYNDIASGDDDRIGYEWAGSFNAIHEKGPFGMLGTWVLGDNGSQAFDRSGRFYGTTLMPWYWIVEKKLQGVLQYSYSGSVRPEGIRANTRYLTGENAPPGVELNNGRGDKLHTLYSGLNYHLCDHHVKFMGGIEYARLNTPIGEIQSITYILGVRMRF